MRAALVSFAFVVASLGCTPPPMAASPATAGTASTAPTVAVADTVTDAGTVPLPADGGPAPVVSDETAQLAGSTEAGDAYAEGDRASDVDVDTARAAEINEGPAPVVSAPVTTVGSASTYESGYGFNVMSSSAPTTTTPSGTPLAIAPTSAINGNGQTRPLAPPPRQTTGTTTLSPGSTTSPSTVAQSTTAPSTPNAPATTPLPGTAEMRNGGTARAAEVMQAPIGDGSTGINTIPGNSIPSNNISGTSTGAVGTGVVGGGSAASNATGVGSGVAGTTGSGTGVVGGSGATGSAVGTGAPYIDPAALARINASNDALAAAQLAAARAGHPELRNFARDVQSSESSNLPVLMNEAGLSTQPTSTSAQDLAALSGEEFDRVYLESAIAARRDFLDAGNGSDAANAQAQRELDQLEGWFDTWY